VKVESLDDVARAMYAAYGETTGNKNYLGNPMPAWAGLGEVIQRAWLAAASVGYVWGYRDHAKGLDSLAMVED